MSLSRRSVFRRATAGGIAILTAITLPKSPRARAQDDIFGDYELICTEDGVRIRSKPSLSAEVRGTVNSGDSVWLTGVSVEADGYRWMPVTIRTGGEELIGWTTTTYFRRPNGELGWLPGTVVHVNTTQVNLHAGAGINYTIVGNFNTGTNAVVNDGPTSADGYSWYNITIDKVTGWMVQDYLTQGPHSSDSTDTLAIASTSLDPLSPVGITVAAFGSPAWMKAAADYVCDGVDDQVEWQAAIDAAQSWPSPPDVIFMPGSYNLSQPITWGTCDLVGNGALVAGSARVYWSGAAGATVITKTNGGTGGMYGISFRGPVPGGNEPLTWIDFSPDQIDKYTRLDEVHFVGCSGPQVRIGLWYNLHWRNLRFDKWGTYAIEINPGATGKTWAFQASFAIENFTADNGRPTIPNNGFINIVTPTTGASNAGVIRLSNGRIEMNQAMTTPRALVNIKHEGATNSRNRTFQLEFENVTYQDVVSDPLDVIVHRDSAGFVGQESLTFINCNLGASTFWSGNFDPKWPMPPTGVFGLFSTMQSNPSVMTDVLRIATSAGSGFKSFQMRQGADTVNRIEAVGAGEIWFGPGVSTAPDVRMYRSGTATLRVNPNLAVTGSATVGGALDHDGTTVGFYRKTPVTQPAANANTSGATLAQLETEVNELKAALRALGLIAT